MLKHQADAALLRREVNAARAVEPDLVRVFRIKTHPHKALQAGASQQAGNGAQHAGLAAARRADDGQQFAGRAVKLGVEPDRTAIFK